MPEPAEKTPSLLLKGGTVVNHDYSQKADVLIRNGVITDIGCHVTIPEGTEIIDVSDRYLLPGGVDLDCHMSVSCVEDPVADTYATGSTSALLGGTTTIVNTVYTEPDASLIDAVEQFHNSAAGQFKCDYAVSIRLPRFDKTIADQMQVLVKEHGVCIVQLQPGSDEHVRDHVLNTEQFHHALRACRENGILPCVMAATSPPIVTMLAQHLLSKHPTIGPELHALSQPERGEADTILRATTHAFHCGQVCPLLITRIHSRQALECFLEQRRSHRAIVFGQTTVGAIGAPLAAEQTEHISFTESEDWIRASGFVTDPPLRPNVSLSEKLLVECASTSGLTVGSGHCAVSTEVRGAFATGRIEDMPKGVATLGCRLPVLWHCGIENTTGLDPCSFVRATSTDPARLINLYPQKGCIAVGSDADIVVWSKVRDPESDDLFKKLVPNIVYNIFSGLHITSKPELVLLRGAIVVKNGCVVEEAQSSGKYLPLKPYAPLTFGRLKVLDAALREDQRPVQREPYTGKVAKTEPLVNEVMKEHHFFRKSDYDNIPKTALPPGQRQIHTSVKTVQPPGGSSQGFW